MSAHLFRKLEAIRAKTRFPRQTMVMMIATSRNGANSPGQPYSDDAHQKPAATAPVMKTVRHCH